MFLILTLIVLVGGLNIISGMTMLVRDKAGASPSFARWARRGLDPQDLHHHGSASACWARFAGSSSDLRLRGMPRACGSSSRGLRARPCSRRNSIPLAPPGRCAAGRTITIVVMALTLSLLATLYRPGRRGNARSGRSAAGGISDDRCGLQLANVSRAFGSGENQIRVLDGADFMLQPARWWPRWPIRRGQIDLLHIAGLLEHADKGEVFIGQTATPRSMTRRARAAAA